MTDMNGVNAVLGSPAGVQQNSSKDQLGQQDFLKLMIAQFQNQDPTKPVDNSKFLGQLAQFGTVSGIQQLQGSFASLSNSLKSDQALRATSLVGHDVLAPGTTAQLPANGQLRGAVSAPDGATAFNIDISDGSGRLIKHLALGSQTGSTARFTWDGTTDNGRTAPAGEYHVSAQAVVNGQSQAIDTYSEGRVRSVSLGADSQNPILNIDGLGDVALGNILAIS